MSNAKQLAVELRTFQCLQNHTTFKGLVGISPSGAVTFRSQLYTGFISNREIVIWSGFLNLPYEGKDSIMADKGFIV